MYGPECTHLGVIATGVFENRIFLMAKANIGFRNRLFDAPHPNVDISNITYIKFERSQCIVHKIVAWI